VRCHVVIENKLRGSELENISEPHSWPTLTKPRNYGKSTEQSMNLLKIELAAIER